MKAFITGYNRSGTTLLDKLLNSHPQIRMDSQPFANLFLLAKRNYLESLGLKPPYFVLEHYFDTGTTDNINGFSSFLESYRPEKKSLFDALQNVNDYSGQFRKWSLHELHALPDGVTFYEVLDYLWERIGLEKEQIKITGSKEVLCEEYIHFLIQKGVKCLLVIRDPRAVLKSMNFGTGTQYIGAIKPSLFNIRNWRKSVAFAIEQEESKKLMVLKHESVTGNWKDTSRLIAEFLSVNEFPKSLSPQNIHDENGMPWHGNSSFAKTQVGEYAISSYSTALEEKCRYLVELLTFPEMKLLGYDTQMDFSTWKDAIFDLHPEDDPFLSLVVNKELFSAYWKQSTCAAEGERAKYLLQESLVAMTHNNRYFISAKHFARLQVSLRII